jgi:mRNA interferase HigB
MDVLNTQLVNDFIKDKRVNAAPFTRFLKVLGATRATSFPDLKRTFGTADAFRGCTVFNVAGNKYRVVAKLDYKCGACILKRAFTHVEYDKWSLKNECC